MSGPLCLNHFAASFMMSCTLMFVLSLSFRYNLSSGMSSGMQSSMSFPVSALRMILLWTSDSGGPDRVVVNNLLIPMNDLAHIPDPTCLHSSSSLGIRSPKILCSGPCL